MIMMLRNYSKNSEICAVQLSIMTALADLSVLLMLFSLNILLHLKLLGNIMVSILMVDQ